MDNLTRMIASTVLAQIKARRAEYDADVDAWYRSGDGRSPNWRTELSDDGTDVRQVNMGGQGHRYPACPHGTDLWTDYDNICGPCEDGYTPYQLALMEAYQIAGAYQSRCDVIAPLTAHRHTLLAGTWKDLQEWSFAPMDPVIRASSERANARSARMAGWRSMAYPPVPFVDDDAREAQAHYDDIHRWN